MRISDGTAIVVLVTYWYGTVVVEKNVRSVCVSDFVHVSDFVVVAVDFGKL